MDFKFLHAADLHLDSPMRGLTRYEGAPVTELREATREALKNLVHLAVEEGVDFVLLAGDLYDGDWRDFNTGLFLQRRLKELEQAGIPVFAVKGNHDADSRITKSLTLPGNVTMFDSRRPHTAKLETLRVAIHGQSFATAKVEEDLSSLYPETVEGFFNIGLLHTSADGRAGHASYAPCTVESLAARGYHYWALGHVHQREVLHREPWIVFPGNIQGRHIRETGEKGATVVTVENHRVIAAEHRSLDVVRWDYLQVDAFGCDHPGEIVALVEEAARDLERSHDDRLLAARLQVRGVCSAHEELLRDLERWQNEMRGAVSERIWLEKIHFLTESKVLTESLADRDDAFAVLIKGIEKLESDEALVSELGRQLFSELERKLPSELRTGEDAFKPTHPDLIRQLLPQVRELLKVRLREAGESGR